MADERLELAAAMVALMLAEEVACNQPDAARSFQLGDVDSCLTFEECASLLRAAKKPLAIATSCDATTVSLCARLLASATELEYQSSRYNGFMSAWAASLGLSFDSSDAVNHRAGELIIETSHRQRPLPAEALAIWAKDYQMPAKIALALVERSSISGLSRVRVSRSDGWSMDLRGLFVGEHRDPEG